jgi:hypothetical protein
VNIPLISRRSGNGATATATGPASVGFDEHHDESKQAQGRADKWMIVGAGLMGMWAPGIIGLPIFLRGSSCSVRRCRRDCPSAR